MAPTLTIGGLALAFASLVQLVGSVSSEAKDVSSTISFSKCSQELYLTNEFECGTLTVPIDHDHPETGKIELFVSRRRGNGTAPALGNLVFNNGGPGASSLIMFQSLSQGLSPFSQEILEEYDIISVDLRGIGLSNPISCDKDIWNNRPEILVMDDESFDSLVTHNKALGESCLRLTGPLVEFMDSVSTIKDLEVLRQALGGEKLNFIGYSYGTLLGQMYVELYPEHVGRFILDAVIDHAPSDDIYGVMTETQTYEATLKQFFAWCKETADECPIADNDLPALFKNLTVLNSSIPAPQCNGTCKAVATGEDILFGTEDRLAFKESKAGFIDANWSTLAGVLYAAANGDGSAFSRNLFQKDVDENPSESNFANRAVWCQDYGTTIRSATDVKRIVDFASALTPLTRGASESLDARVHCVGWPTPVRNPPHRLDAGQVAKLPPLMLVNAFYDPETSPVWAEAVRNQLPSAVTVWRDGAGHSSYILFGETSKAMDEFLINGNLPKDGTVYNS